MNFCPVCTREYRQTSGRNQSGRCPVCGSTLVHISDSDLNQVRKDESAIRPDLKENPGNRDEGIISLR